MPPRSRSPSHPPLTRNFIPQIDAYDLFTINLIVPILNVQYNHKNGGTLLHAPLQGGVLKAAANLGCVVGQILFGVLGDIYGRRRIYPLGLIVAMFGVVMTIACPSDWDGSKTFTWITVWRVIMGVRKISHNDHRTHKADLDSADRDWR